MLLIGLFFYAGRRLLVQSLREDLNEARPLVAQMVIGNTVALSTPGAKIPSASLAAFPPYSLDYLDQLNGLRDLIGSLYGQNPSEVSPEHRELCEMINDDIYRENDRRPLPAEFTTDHGFILFSTMLESDLMKHSEDLPYILLAAIDKEGDAAVFHVPSDLATAEDGAIYFPPELGSLSYDGDGPAPQMGLVSQGPHGEAVDQHLGSLFGDDLTVYHELLSELIHLDVYFIAAAEERPFITFVTSGMSDLPMNAPEGEENQARAELMMRVPGDWPMGEEAFKDPANYWPVGGLKFLARFPHYSDSWLSYGHTIPNGDPAEPFAQDVPFVGVILGPPAPVLDGISPLEIADGDLIHFWSVIPLYQSEMDYKLEHGADALFAKLRAAGHWDLVDKTREPVV